MGDIRSRRDPHGRHVGGIRPFLGSSNQEPTTPAERGAAGFLRNEPGRTRLAGTERPLFKFGPRRSLSELGRASLVSPTQC